MWLFLQIILLSIPYYSIIWLSSLACLMTGILWLMIRRGEDDKKVCEYLANFKGPSSLPFLGSALLLNVENHELFQICENHVKNYGKISKIWLFRKPYVIIADADVVEKILTSKLNLDKGDDVQVFHPWWGSGLLTAPTNKWKNQRKLLNHAFSHSVLVEFLEIFNKESLLLKNQLEKYEENAEIFNIIPPLTTTTLNIICETVMGKKPVAEDEILANQEYKDAVTGMCYILVARMTRPWLRPELIWKLTAYGKKEKAYLKVLHGFTEKVIEEKRELRRKSNNSQIKDEGSVEGKKCRKAFVDYLLDFCDNGHELSNLEIRNEVDNFMAAGHDTTAYTVAWTLFLLATYPEHQVKVQEELDHLFDHDQNKPVSSLDLSKMPYLTMCIKEALRIYPILPFNLRKVSEDIKCDEKHTIPSGVNVIIMPYMLHKDPLYFPNPGEFQPNRFLAENCHKRHPFAYIPFSGGPRNCIGQKFGINKAKVILTYLLRSFNWTTTDSRDQVKLDLDVVSRPIGGLKFKICKR